MEMNYHQEKYLHSTILNIWTNANKVLILFKYIVLYCILFLFSPNIIHMLVDSSVCNIF